MNIFKKQILSIAILAGLGLGCIPEAKAELTTVQKVREGALYLTSVVVSSVAAGVSFLAASNCAINTNSAHLKAILAGSALGYKVAQKFINWTWNKREYSELDIAAITSSIEFLVIPAFISITFPFITSETKYC